LTVNRTPFVGQYFVVTTAIRSLSAANPGKMRANSFKRGMFAGFIRLAASAALIQRFLGSRFGVQTIMFDIAIPP
jgi:hypothetical protein